MYIDDNIMNTEDDDVPNNVSSEKIYTIKKTIDALKTGSKDIPTDLVAGWLEDYVQRLNASNAPKEMHFVLSESEMGWGYAGPRTRVLYKGTDKQAVIATIKKHYNFLVCEDDGKEKYVNPFTEMLPRITGEQCLNIILSQVDKAIEKHESITINDDNIEHDSDYSTSVTLTIA